MPIEPRSFTEAAVRLATWKRPLLMSHERPDGDALGCLLAMQHVLRRRGQDPLTVLFEPCPHRFAWLAGADALQVMSSPDALPDSGDGAVDGVICMDTASLAQVRPFADWLRARKIPLIVLDHHVTRDMDADIWLIDETAAAASLIVYHWLCSEGWPLQPDTAEALFVGITTDTGWFRYSNTSAAALQAGAELLALGVDPDRCFQNLYMQDTIAQLRCRAAAMASLELHCADRVALQLLSQAAMAECGATSADTSESVNAPMSSARVEVAGLLVDTGDGLIKCSLRSKGGVDVAALAARHGGGGHQRAAGLRVQGSLESVRDLLVRDLNDALQG